MQLSVYIYIWWGCVCKCEWAGVLEHIPAVSVWSQRCYWVQAINGTPNDLSYSQAGTQRFAHSLDGLMAEWEGKRQ